MTICTRVLLAPEDASRLADLSTERLRQLARAGLLSAVKLSNGRLVFPVEAIDELSKRRGRRVAPRN